MNNQPNFTQRTKAFIIWCIAHRITFTISVCFFAIVAGCYLYFTPKEYQASTAFTLKFDTIGIPTARDMKMLTEVSFINQRQSFPNEMQSFGSIILAEEIVKMLNLENEIYLLKAGTKSLLYKDSPIAVTFTGECNEFKAEIDFDDDYKSFTLSEIEVDGNAGNLSPVTAKPGEKVETPYGAVTILPTGQPFNGNKRYKLEHRNTLQAARKVSKNLTFHPASLYATVVNFTYTDNSKERALDILTALPTAYNIIWREYMTLTTKKANSFIEEQLSIVEAELNEIETYVAQIQGKDRNINTQLSAKLNAGQQSKIKAEGFSTETQLYIAKNILKNIESTRDSLVILPMNTGISNNAINSQIAEYNTRIIQLDRIIREGGQANPTAKSLKTTAINLKESIKESIAKEVSSLSIALKETNKEASKLDNRVNTLSSSERKQEALLRRIICIQEIYIFLKQKQEECLLSMNNNWNAIRGINEPTVKDEPSSPSPKLALIIVIFFGIFLIPYIIYTFSSILKRKVTDLEELKGFDIIGKLPTLKSNADLFQKLHIGKKRLAMPKISTQENIVDAFQLLAANIEFLCAKCPNTPVLVLTSWGSPWLSATSALNLANAMALKSKVLLIDTDMRFCQIEAGQTGTSEILNNLATVKESTEKMQRFDMIPSGTIPPNPTELLSEHLDKLHISELKEKYEYIIINAAPLDGFSDAELVSQIADKVFINVESNTMNLNAISELQNTINERRLPKTYLIPTGFR